MRFLSRPMELELKHRPLNRSVSVIELSALVCLHSLTVLAHASRASFSLRDSYATSILDPQSMINAFVVSERFAQRLGGEVLASRRNNRISRRCFQC